MDQSDCKRASSPSYPFKNEVTHHGIALPLFSLRTRQSSGIGEFLDLLPLIDWCQKIGFDSIQLLPLNDTGGDPSPYNAISSCALDPIYLSLAPFGLSNEPFQELTQKNRLDHRAVLEQKIEVLYRHFKATFSPTPAYQLFVDQNPWLSTYTAFKVKKNGLEPAFYSFLQFHSFAQMQAVKAYASQKKVFLQGDIPILLSPDSADVSAEPYLFHRDLQAGAPPDGYNSQGQHWGFPLFNWDAMRREQFAWWKQRLQVAERLFHLFRIDHIVGFFRIWGIERGKKPTEGSFFPSDPAQWVPQGKELLAMLLSATSMTPIGEDLGIIPREVPPILKELGICGTKVIRWQRNWDTDQSYIPFDQYEPLSVTTLSTHDMDPLLLWWQKYPSESIPFAAFMKWPYHSLLSPEHHFEILRASHHTSSFYHINPLQEYLALFPELIAPNLEDERINIPGTVLPLNWTYRFRPYLEEIAAHSGLSNSLKKILT